MPRQIFRDVLLLLYIFSVSCYDPEVEIPQGILRGGIRANIDGGIYYSFVNVPYAKPPVGNLRFKAPEPAEGWKGTRNAAEDMPQCIQQSGQGQEDCLYLNIYTPGLPAENATLKPVMVYIFGGGFSVGNASESSYGAQFLLTEDVVLVVPNYRLGILGFLSLDDPDLGATGNAGLKDQVQALKWVQDNIEYFGGDPNNVLLFGESAGGMAVHLNMLSPMSQGLFKKAISHSNVGLCNDIITPHVRNTAVLVAEVLGIQTNNWDDMLISLQNESVEALSAAAHILRNTDRYFTVPFPEMKGSNEPTFFEDDVIDIIRSGNYNHVPFMMGFNDAEALWYQKWVITDFTDYIPSDLGIEPRSDEEVILSERIKYYYYGDTEPGLDDVSQAISLGTDFEFGYPVYRTAVEHMKTALAPIYFYFFTADTELNLVKRANGITFPGASHTDDLGYLFLQPDTPDIKKGSVEDLALRRMVKLWTNFAHYGNPTPIGSEEFGWEAVQTNQFNYAQIDTDETRYYINPKAKNFEFWSGVYNEYFEK